MDDERGSLSRKTNIHAREASLYLALLRRNISRNHVPLEAMSRRVNWNEVERQGKASGKREREMSRVSIETSFLALMSLLLRLSVWFVPHFVLAQRNDEAVSLHLRLQMSASLRINQLK